MRFKTALLSLTMPLALAACSSGGGGGGSSSGQSGPLTLDSTASDFTSFSDITANSLVEAQSGGGAVNYAAEIVPGSEPPRPNLSGDLTTTGSSALRILSGAEIPPVDPEDDPELEFRGARLTVNLPGDAPIVRDFMKDSTEVGTGLAADRFVAFEIENDDEVVTDRLYVEDSDELNYMTFGMWELGLDASSRDIGGAAWGALTPTVGDNAMPTGTASYLGDLIGYNVVAGSTTVYVAQSNISANFDSNAVTFSSSVTRNLATGVVNTDFNIRPASGTIDGNTFSGSGLRLQAAPDTDTTTFAGTFGGAFYGPNAAEAGGWFELRNQTQDPAADRYFGSFGGAKLP